jgi:hypothetical protein
VTPEGELHGLQLRILQPIGSAEVGKGGFGEDRPPHCASTSGRFASTEHRPNTECWRRVRGFAVDAMGSPVFE